MASMYCELTTRQAPRRELCKCDILTPTQLSASGTTIIPICREAHLVSEIKSNVSKATQVTTELDPLQDLYQLLRKASFPNTGHKCLHTAHSLLCVSRLAEASL